MTVHELVLLDCFPPFLTLQVTCSKGTYIRVLGEDIGGSRMRCASEISPAGQGSGLLTLASRRDAGRTGKDGGKRVTAIRPRVLEPVDYLLSSFPSVRLDATQTNRFRNGQRLSAVREAIDVSAGPGRRRVYAAESGVFLGTAQLRSDGVLAPERLVSLGPGFFRTLNVSGKKRAIRLSGRQLAAGASASRFISVLCEAGKQTRAKITSYPFFQFLEFLCLKPNALTQRR